MNKFVTGLCAFCCLVVTSSEQRCAQFASEPRMSTNAEKPLIRVDENFTGYFNDLVGRDVEVIGKILFAGEAGKDEELQEWVSTSRGGFILTNWGRLWKNKQVRVIGHVTKGIDEHAEFVKQMKPGEHMPAMAFRIEYLLTIKSIELLDAAEKPPQLSLAPQLPPQLPPQQSQRLPYLPKPLVRIDQNFKGAYGDLLEQDVEVCGIIRQATAGENKFWIDPGDRGGLEIANLDTKWFQRKVRIVGTIAKGIDPDEVEMKKNWKPGQPMIARAFRYFYVLTIKSIELDEAEAPANSVDTPALPAPQR